MVLYYNNVYKIFNVLYGMKSRMLIFGIVLVSFLAFSFALNVDVEFESNSFINDFYVPIDFTIDFSDVDAGNYNVYTFADLYITPAEMFYMSKDSSLEFSIMPFDRLDMLGAYAFTYVINQRGIDKINKKKTINFYDLEDVVSIESNNIDFEDGIVKLFIDNTVDVDLKNLTVRFNSILFDFEETFDLDGEEITTIDVDLDADVLKKIKAGTYVINAKFESGSGTQEILGKLYLDAKKGIKVSEDFKGFFVRRQILGRVNNGNTVEIVEIEASRNIFSRLFTSFSEEPLNINREGGRVYYSWEKKLNPDSNYEIVATSNYFYPILIIVLVYFIIWAVRKLFATKVYVKKSAVPIKTKNGEFALRVTLSVKARWDVEELSVVDRVPNTVKLYRKSFSVHPDAIDVQTRSMKWKIEELNAGEERSFSYIVYSRVGYVGKFSLPRATVKYKIDEIMKQDSSNGVFFLAEQKDGEDNKND